MSTSSHRLGATALATVLACAGMLAAAPPTQATVLGTAQFVSQVGFDDDPTGTTCTQTGPGDVTSPVANFLADGVPVTSAATSSAVITDNGNAADVTSLAGSASRTVTATQAGGQLNHLRVTDTASTSVTTAIANTKCGASVGVGGEAQFQFDLVAPALVTVTAESHRMIGLVQVGNLMGPSGSDVEAVVAYAVGTHGTSTGTSLLSAGTGFIGINLSQADLSAPASAGTVSRSGDFTLDISFDVPGSATGAQSGSGGKYVKAGAGRDCAAGTLPLTWTKKAGKGKHRVVNKAIVKVNGVKVAKIKKPKKKQVSIVSGLDPEKAAAVEIIVRVKGKGKFVVDRSYLRCT